MKKFHCSDIYTGTRYEAKLVKETKCYYTVLVTGRYGADALQVRFHKNTLTNQDFGMYLRVEDAPTYKRGDTFFDKQGEILAVIEVDERPNITYYRSVYCTGHFADTDTEFMYTEPEMFEESPVKTSTPSGHEDRARQLEARGMYKQAARQWFKAKARSIGHKRRDRYEAHMERCDKLALEACQLETERTEHMPPVSK